MDKQTPEESGKPKDPRGGQREGAGRPPKDSVTVTFTLDKEIYEKAQALYKGRLSKAVDGFFKTIVDLVPPPKK